MGRKSATDLVERGERQVVHLDPDRALPVVLALAELGVCRREAVEAVRRPEVRRVAEQVEDRAEVRRVRREEREQEREEREVALVADVVGVVCDAERTGMSSARRLTDTR